MFYLLCAIISSALVSIIMRLSTDKVENNISMLAMNYLMCSVVAAAYAGFGQLFPQTETLGATLGMGVFQGILYLLSFILLQVNVRKNGVVLPATFMKLGLLVPMVISIFLFREIPAPMQIIGFCIATAAILLINLDKSQSAVSFKTGLILPNAGNYIQKLVCTDIGILLLREEAWIYGPEEAPVPNGYPCPPWLDMQVIPSLSA